MTATLSAASVRARRTTLVLGLYVTCIAVALVLAAILVAATGGSATKMFSAILDGSLRNDGAWGETLARAAPLLIVAVGTMVASRAGLVNIGQEGQLLLGAIFAAYAGNRLGGPGWLVIIVTLALAFVGGAIWSGIAAVLRFRRGVPEVLSTLLLAFVSYRVLEWGLRSKSLLLDTSPTERQQLNTGTQLPASVRLPKVDVFGNQFHIGVLLAIAIALAGAFVLTRTVWGFRLRMLGLNPRTAQRAGVTAAVVGTVALLISGGLAGLAGGVLLTGTPDYRITLGYSRNFGWDGLLVALLARDKPLLAIPMAFVFAILRTGGAYLAVTGVAGDIVDVVKALLVLSFLVPAALLYIRDRRQSLALMRSRT
jgi:ABC-type uncharacterized transport system permease subunit